MKKIILVLSILTAIVFTNCKDKNNETAVNQVINTSSNEQQKLKRYEVKSGEIHYSIKTNGKVMGGTVSGTGTEKLIFKDWGALEIVEEKSSTTTKINVFGHQKNETSTVHTLNKLDNGDSYSVDFDAKVIYKNKDLAMEMTKMFQPDKDAGKVGKSMLEGMGGKKVGNETFLGYECEIWEAMGTKQWIYKGVTLKLEANVMGITTSKEATSAKFNISIPNTAFDLPDFPVTKMEGFMGSEDFDASMDDSDQYIDAMKNMTFEQWKQEVKDDPEIQQMTEEELKEAYEMIQKMIKLKNN